MEIDRQVHNELVDGYYPHDPRREPDPRVQPNDFLDGNIPHTEPHNKMLASRKKHLTANDQSPANNPPDKNISPEK